MLISLCMSRKGVFFAILYRRETYRRNIVPRLTRNGRTLARIRSGEKLNAPTGSGGGNKSGSNIRQTVYLKSSFISFRAE